MDTYLIRLFIDQHRSELAANGTLAELESALIRLEELENKNKNKATLHQKDW